VPNEFLSDVGAIDWPLRRTFEGMMHCVDSAIGNVTAALSAKGMWEKSLVVFSSDNGGREDANFGGNNYPLRGTFKMTQYNMGMPLNGVSTFVLRDLGCCLVWLHPKQLRSRMTPVY